VAGANLPVLFEILGQPEGEPWRVWAEMSADTAQQYKVVGGSTVRIVSQYGGAIDAVAIVVEGMVSGTIAVAYVPANDLGGRWAGLLQADARALLGPDGAASQTSVRMAPV
jgi:predicted molibdopterin-dependent oxidoreductase YjgC